jgi:hypothetical protein
MIKIKFLYNGFGVLISFLLILASCNMQKSNDFCQILKYHKKEIVLKSEFYNLMDLYNYYVTNNLPLYEILPEAYYVAEYDNYSFSYQLIYLATLSKYGSYNEIDSKNHISFYKMLTDKEKISIIKYLDKGANNNDPNCLGYIIDIYKYEKNESKVGYYLSIEKKYNALKIVN